MTPKGDRPPGPPGAALAPSGQTESSSNVEKPLQPEDKRWWHSRDYLPHFESSSVVQHLTFRLADSLPAHVVAGLAASLEKVHVTRREIERRQRIEAFMDAGHGSCVLRVPEIAELVESNLLFGDGVRYRLIAWVIMPNHVHALIQPISPWVVAKIVASWKSYTGRRISDWRIRARAAPGGPGRGISAGGEGYSEAEVGVAPVWHREYWDRYARNAAHVDYFRDYIHRNPVKAGLVRRPEDWSWSSAFPRDRQAPPWQGLDKEKSD